jgi:protein phosphatase
MWKTLEIVRKNRLLILAHLSFVVVIVLLWFFVPKPLITYPQFIDALSYVLLVAFGATLCYGMYVYIGIRRRLREIKEDIKRSRPLLKEVGCLSDTGKVRQLDEDGIIVVKAFSTYGPSPGQLFLLTIADGMGGHSKGEVASYLGAITMVEHIVPELVNREEHDFGQTLLSSMKEANERILKHATEHQECEGMGTTMTSAIIEGNRTYISHVGDTRAYAISEERIKQLTKDHSQVQELVDKGMITPAEARHHPQKNVITRVVGYYADVQPDVYNYDLEANDHLLLCCDGLVADLEDQEIADVVLNSFTTSKACKSLVKMADDRGGKDNISVILTPSVADLSTDDHEQTKNKRGNR